ncbi:amidohydrolase [Lactobacillus delbrueckii subsp. bulgaricus]|nr:amidohydrolase [Lactobacillus delbrueckii subsp. bulgaricus]
MHGAACTPPLVNSISEMQEALRHTPEYGQGLDVWIEGWGFDESKLAEHRSPTRDDLDQVSTTQPIFLYRSDCHSSVGNSRTLELAGIDEHTPDPAGGKIEKDYYVADEVAGPLEIEKSDRLRVAGLKVFMDGSISGETALMKDAFPSGKKGVALTSEDRLREIIAYARENKLQVAVHAMGDAAIQRVIDVCQDLDPWLEGQPSVRIEHASLLSDSMLKELKGSTIGLAVSTQPIFFFAEEDSYRQFLSADQLKMAYRIKSLDKENILFSLSSDAPWAEPDSPFYGIYAAVTRHTAAGGFINEDEGIPVVRAILAYTRDAAKMGGFVNNGTLTPGKDADFVILDRDIFSQKAEDLAKVKPASTWIGREKVWSQEKK